MVLTSSSLGEIIYFLGTSAQFKISILLITFPHDCKRVYFNNVDDAKELLVFDTAKVNSKKGWNARSLFPEFKITEVFLGNNFYKMVFFIRRQAFQA